MFAKKNGVKLKETVITNEKTNKRPLNKTTARLEIESDEEVMSQNKSNANRSVSRNYNDNSEFQTANPVGDTYKIESIKSELLEIFSEIGLDPHWVKHDFKILDRSASKESHMMDVQIKVIKLFASKLKRERENRLKTENQFQNLTEKYTKQMEFIEENFNNHSSLKEKGTPGKSGR